MAQADYIDPTQRRINDTLARTRAASQNTIANATPRASYPSAAGISVTDLAQPEITRADIQSRATQLGAQGGAANVPGSDIPAAARRAAAPGISVGEVDPSTLSANERAGLGRQGYVAPRPSIIPEVAPATAVPPAATAAPVVETAGPSGARAALGTAGRFASRALGVAGVAGDALGAVGDVRRGDYAGAGQNVALGALDTAAIAAPSPITAGAALTGHLAQGAFGEGGPLDFVPKGIASAVLHAQGVQSPDEIRAEIDQRNAARAARGLPVPAQRLPNQTVYPPASFGVNADAASTAPETGPRPSIVAQPQATSDAGRPLPGRVLPGYGRTFSDGSGDPNAPGYIPRTTSAAEIANAGKRISIADAGVGGNIASEAAGGTLNLGDGPARNRAGFSPADRRQQLADIERQGNRAEMSRLLKKSETELARGNKKTAGILAGLAEAYKTGEPESPTTNALAQAKIAESNAATANSVSETRRRDSQNNLVDQALGEPDDNKRASIYDTLLASQGKNSDRIVSLKQQVGTDQIGNPIFNELPFDTRSRRFLYQPQQQANSIIP